MFFSHFILYDIGFQIFQLMVFSCCVMIKEKMKFETQAFNKDVEQKE